MNLCVFCDTFYATIPSVQQYLLRNDIFYAMPFILWAVLIKIAGRAALALLAGAIVYGAIAALVLAALVLFIFAADKIRWFCATAPPAPRNVDWLSPGTRRFRG